MREEMERTADKISKEANRMDLGDIIWQIIKEYMNKYGYYEEEDDVREAYDLFEEYLLQEVFPDWLRRQMPVDHVDWE